MTALLSVTRKQHYIAIKMSTLSVACKRYIVSGKVQGVFFRASTRNRAQELNLTGYAKNLSNGKVEVIACGTQASLDVLEAWLNHGPAAAKVTNLECENIVEQSFSNFHIY